jgi:selenocysteine lyase/cysteine desulfurase
VFIGPYEHHSNELPWRETACEVVVIPLADDGNIDRSALEDALRRYRTRPLKIGSFSAASNVTGVRSDVVGITRSLKDAGALAFWDYAAAAPYVGIDLNASGAPIDAVFISPHKFVGGPGTPGVLAVKADLLQNEVPAVVGGGTVSFVGPGRHRYLRDTTRREEGGTPPIVESIRAGLVFQLQQTVGTHNIERREALLVARAVARLSALDNVEILGPPGGERLSIFSLRFFHDGRELHYGFITALLNDLFGIQVRGGCSCAGPYGHALLSLDDERSKAIEEQVDAGQSAMRPGWVRLNFNYFIDENEFEYLLTALELVAQCGWRLLASYRLDAASGVWRHRDGRAPDTALALFSTAPTPPADSPTLDATLDAARSTLASGASAAHRAAARTDPPMPPGAEALRWFLLPRESTGAQLAESA